MNEVQRKPLWKPLGVFLVGAIAIAMFGYSFLPPSIATWQATSFEVDRSLSQKVSIEAQIRAIEKRDPHKDFAMYARDQNLFLYAVADTQVIIPGVDHFTLPFLFPVRVITGTGEAGAGGRNEHLNQVARKFAEQFNQEMYGYMVTW